MEGCSVGPNRYQCWWQSELLGWRCDAYPTPGQATDRLEDVQQREHFIRGLAIDMQDHLTSQAAIPTRQEFDRRHAAFTQEMGTNV